MSYLIEPPISFDGSKWFLVIAQLRREMSVQAELEGMGHRTFMPKLRKWVSHARVKQAVERPVLGRYLFVEVDYPRQSFAAISNVRGVDSILANNGIPVVVASKWVEGLIVRQLRGEWDEIAQNDIPLGARVRILEGEFNDMLATVTSYKGNQILVKLQGSAKITKVHKASLGAA